MAHKDFEHAIFDPTARQRRTNVAAPAWWQRLAAHQTRCALAQKQELSLYPREVWQARLTAFDQHVARVTPWQATVWLATQLLDLLHPVRLLASWALFPSQRRAWPKAAEVETLPGFAAVPQCFITRDHAVLDGTLLRRKGSHQRPGPIVLVPPNGAAWEVMTDVMALLAQQTQRDVLAFNYRGTAASVGSVCGTTQAVVDVETALRRAQQLGDGAPIAVLGASMGGGCATEALHALRRRGVFKPRDVDAFAAVHTFRSLPATISAVAPFLGQRAPKMLLPLLGMTSLNSAATLTQAPLPLASRVFVVNARNDGVIRPAAALVLSEDEQRSMARRGTEVTQLTDVGDGHMDLRSFSEPNSWLQQLAPA